MTNEPTGQRNAQSEAALPLGPAVSRPGQMPPQVGGVSPDQVPPFAPARSDTATRVEHEASAKPAPETPDAAPELEPTHGSPAADAAADLTWLDAIDWGDEAVAESPPDPGDARARPSPPVAAHATGQPEGEALPAWMAWVAGPKEGDAGTQVQEVGTLVEDYGEPGEVAGGFEADSVEGPPPGEAAQRPAAAMERGREREHHSTDALREVADRLERLAASLRSKSIGELLADANRADPLELLITGFVLGAATRGSGDG
jgi:hypothetical protein